MSSQPQLSSCQGTLIRKTSILRRWKEEWMSLRLDLHQNGALESGGETRHRFQAGNFQVQPASTDPASPDFLGFQIQLSQYAGGPPKVHNFRTTDAAAFRKWMLALGCRGAGVIAQREATDGSGDPSSETGESWLGLYDVLHPSLDELTEEIEKRNAAEKAKEAGAPQATEGGLPTYQDVMGKDLAFSFYFPEGIEKPANSPGMPQPLGAPLPVAMPGMPIPAPASPVSTTRRPIHDTFRPPHGPVVLAPVSIGYGAEVGLAPWVQELWDPVHKRSFFIDHSQFMTFWDDPRPPQRAKVVVTTQSIAYGDQRYLQSPLATCRDPHILEYTAQRSATKTHAYQVAARGNNGQHGRNGSSGRNGSNGSSGHSGSFGGHGGNGSSGGHGSNGEHGSDATDATNASDVHITLSGNCDQLIVGGSFDGQLDMGGMESESILFINAHGGDGGHGGSGGSGGSGGRGGDGGRGGSGRDGQSASSPGARGGDGGPGGNGGNGGNGGDGGDGGNGGRGGNAGKGGDVVVYAADPRLLIMVEMDVLCGQPGSGGSGGRLGSGGSGGSAGSAGCGGFGGMGGPSDPNRNISSGPSGSAGMPGHSGNSGRRGRDGKSGRSGSNGAPAANGSLLWCVTGPTGDVVLKSFTRYDVNVTDFSVVSAIDDGIFEPNERITISSVTFNNDGGLPLPAGAETLFPTTRTVHFEPTRCSLPEVPSGSQFVVPGTFSGRIFDQPPPNAPGPFKGTAVVKSRIELLGRPFERAELPRELVVQYPIQIASLVGPSHLGRGEGGMLKVAITNISRMDYGDVLGSGGQVAVKIRLDRRLLPRGRAQSDAYTITHDPTVPDSLHIQVHRISAGETLDLCLNIEMESRAELFDKCIWQADVFLRGKFIEYNFDAIRVSPYYIRSDPPADMLFVTNEMMTRKQFCLWQRMLECFKLRVDFWDTERYHGLSVDARTNERHETSWVGHYKGKVILFPHANATLFNPADVVDHFYGDSFKEAIPTDLDSSVFLLLPERGKGTSESLSLASEVCYHLTAVSSPEQIPEGAYGGRHLLPPSPSVTCFGRPAHIKCEAKLVRKFDAAAPFVHFVRDRTVNIQSAQGFLKYTYGEVDLRRLPLSYSARFHVVQSVATQSSSLGEDDPAHSIAAHKVPIGATFGQAMITLIACLGVSYKLETIRGASSGVSDNKWVLQLPNGIDLTLAQVAAICLQEDLVTEIFGEAKTLRRTDEVTNLVGAQPALYSSSETAKLLFECVAVVEERIRKMCKKRPRPLQTLAAFQRQAQQIRQHLMDAGNRHEMSQLDEGAKRLAASSKGFFTLSMLFSKDEHLCCNRPLPLSRFFDLTPFA